jgi:GcrA cell cycle regulator
MLMSWTDERVAELQRLWIAGHSAAVIGRQLGVSKNAVIGKAHRMNLANRPSPIKKCETPAPEMTKPVVVPETRASRGPQCRWPFGDPGDPGFHFCEAQAMPGKPYCAEHYARAYIPNRPRERDRGRVAA